VGDPLTIAAMEKQFEQYTLITSAPQLDLEDFFHILSSALYYARRCQILETQLAKTRVDLREIVSDATTIRVQAALAEDPYPQDPNEV
jgi:hypothetical protein